MRSDSMDTTTTIFVIVLTIFAEKLLERFGKDANDLIKAWLEEYRKIKIVK